MSVFEKGLITILACACLCAALSIPLILRKVPRNVVYGFRTPATLGDDFLWYEANAHFGRRLLIASCVSAVGVLTLYFVRVSPAFFLKASLVVLLVPLLIAVLATARYLRSLKRSGPQRDDRM
jgi:uncharacterized membrane protein